MAIAATTWTVSRAAGPFSFASLRQPASPAEARQREILKANTDKPADEALSARFAAINLKFFGGALPALTIRWEPALADVGPLMGDGVTLQGMFGRAGTRQMILINPGVRDDAAALDRALCHEMVHAYLYMTGDENAAHGPAFQAVLARLANQHAFEGIVADAAQKAALKAWLDAESSRLDEDHRDLEAADAELKQDAVSLDREITEFNARADRPPDEARALEARRDQFNLRISEATERIQRNHDAVAHFQAEVSRYNLMMVYPDGEGVTPVRSVAK
jgi:hypothetical protein